MSMNITSLAHDGRGALYSAIEDCGPAFWNAGAAALTVDRIAAALAQLGPFPPAPIFASSRLFPAAHAWCFERGEAEGMNQTYLLAHPAFWDALARREARPLRADRPLGDLFAIEIVELDAMARDDPRRLRIFDALCDATGLPRGAKG